jgi:thiamine transport system permease protein
MNGWPPLGIDRPASAGLWVIPCLILLCVAAGVLPLLGFAWQQGGAVSLDAYALQVLRFTLLQALLSTVLSVIPAVFVARALARRQFKGRDFCLTLLAIPLSLPVIVAIFGITSIYGARSFVGGWFNLYGLGGILLAHVFFNVPLATRLLLQALENVPQENHLLAAQLNFSDAVVFRHVEWPVLKTALPRIVALIFLLCASSFVIVLIFGGVKATTLEVAIYQSLRMDFDVTRALTLTLFQMALSAVLVWAAAQALLHTSAQRRNVASSQRFDGRSLSATVLDYSLIGMLVFLVLPVLLNVFWQGIAHLELSIVMMKALGSSLAIVAFTLCLGLPAAWLMAVAQFRLPHWRRLLMGLSLAGYGVPPAVLATGWFLSTRQFDGHILLVVVLIAVMNALMALPFALSVLAPALEAAAHQNDRLCQQLGIQGWNRFYAVDLPAAKGPVLQALLMIFVLSLGDLTAVTLLGSDGLLTLPALIQQQMGRYQTENAGGTALILTLLCAVAAHMAQRFSRWT